MQPGSEHFGQFVGLIVAFYLVFIVVIMAIIIIPTWFICKKAGFSPWLSLLNIVPLGGLVLLYVLAFAEWKVIPASQVVWATPQPMPPVPPQGTFPQQPPQA